ncbi:type II secretion system protein N [Chitinasiproducens palmae]|uniref:Type II secretion system protein N n=1 Tax=Chitinasiproducens palmae TaxID=1770053 RepID=A0A1H2PP58_9BURK|nr:type II secretion system protein N [Chitinasiproducens palmae]SDV48477.1 type II secretion system protein N (GspN) [Chitinasiproducens palmae]
MKRRAAARPRATRLRQAWPWCVVALLSCGLTTLAILPAAWLTPQVARLTGARIALVGASGTVWRGAATLQLSAGPDARTATLLPGRLQWRTHVLPLLLGTLRIDLSHDEAMSEPVRLDARPAGATLSAGSMRLPVSLFEGLGAPFNTLALNGELRADWTPWRVTAGRSAGQATLTLRDTRSAVSRVAPLGDYRVRIEAAAGTFDLALSTLKGPLLLDGSGRGDGAGFRFDGTARAEADRLPALRGLIGLLGPLQRDGEARLTFRR